MYFIELSRSSSLVFLRLHLPTFWNSFIGFLSNGESGSSLLLLPIKLYIPVTRLISLIFYIITNLQGSHAHLLTIYLTFQAITCLLVPVHFKFPFLFTSIKFKHSPLSDVIIKLIIFSLLILPPSAPLQCALILF